MKKVYFIHIWHKSDKANIHDLKLYDILKTKYEGKHWSEGLWFIYTDKSASELQNELDQYFYKDTSGNHILDSDIYFIGELGNDYNGYFFRQGFDWLKEHKNEQKVC